MKSSNSSTTVLGLVNSKRRLQCSRRGRRVRFKVLPPYFSYGSNRRLNVLLLVILILLKKYPGWRRIEAANTEGYLPNVHIIIQIAYFTMLGTLASYATAYLPRHN